MTIELQDIRWAIVASRYPSLRQAADRLNVRQSTLSRRLLALEHDVGATLFERTNGGTHLTIEGQEFIDIASSIIENIDAMVVRLKTQSRGELGRLNIGIHTSFSAGNLRATLMEHRRMFPDVELHLADGSSDHLIVYLESSVIDVAFIAGEAPQWVGKTLAVWSERVVVALPDGHPLTGREVVQWSELANERLLVPQRGSGPEFLNLLSRAMGSRDPCKLLHQDVGLDCLLTLVGAKQGLLLALEGATGISYPGIVYREVHDREGPSRLNFRACWRGANGNPSLKPFLELLFERYPDFSAATAVS